MSPHDATIRALMEKVDQLTATVAALSGPAKDATRGLQTSLYTLNSGDTAWMLTSSAIVLFMTMPGLAIYYGGMVQSKNVLAVVMQIFTITCLITVLWLCFGYSLAFCPSGFYPQDGTVNDQTLIYGDASRFWLQGMTYESVSGYQAPTIPESVYCMFQLTFAIITAALICGSFADRMKYWSMVIFIGLWHLMVYCPLAHSMWHANGLLWKYGTLDFAGGNVVHISSGTAGLVTALILGNRKGWKPKGYDSHPPHNILLTYMGMSMLWVGWFGFNAGSAVTSGYRAGFAMLATQIATATASLSWMLTELVFRKKPSVLGMVNGAIAGLVAITPASGYVNMTGAFFTGLFGGSLCYFGSKLKHYVFKIDDALDAFGVHAIGGIVGGICTGFFTDPQITGFDYQAGVFYANTWVGGHQLAKQIVGILYAMTFSAVGTFIIVKALDLTIGIRVSEAEEEAGLDVSLHGESMNEEKAKAEPVKTDNPAYV